MRWTDSQVNELFRLEALGMRWADIARRFQCRPSDAQWKWARQRQVRDNQVHAMLVHAENQERIRRERAQMAPRYPKYSESHHKRRYPGQIGRDR
jgi:hypothetical protein